MALDVAVTVPLRSHAVDVRLSAGAETLALVGPSGAGKTTVLRAIAGLARPQAGRVALDGRAWFDAAAGVHLAPEERSVGFVFQEYALFPHLSVERNVAFGGAARARELLERFGLTALAEARPGQLSGGERQRVALARALARDPAVLLLDEPLSALDAHTRASVRAELQEVLAGFGRPAIVVTHDFTDAAALASRVGVLVEGRLRQVGAPAELVARPADPFVAALTGGNLLIGEAEPAGEGVSRVRVPGGWLSVAGSIRGRVGVAVNPWDVRLSREGGEVRGRVSAVAPAGDRVRMLVGPLRVEVPRAELGRLGVAAGEEVWAVVPREATRVVEIRRPR